jgi:hypothetical protein
VSGRFVVAAGSCAVCKSKIWPGCGVGSCVRFAEDTQKVVGRGKKEVSGSYRKYFLLWFRSLFFPARCVLRVGTVHQLGRVRLEMRCLNAVQVLDSSPMRQSILSAKDPKMIAMK